MAYPYSMTYTVEAGELVLADHLNVSNQEHINNNKPSSIDDACSDAAAFVAKKDPYAGAADVLPLNLEEELREYRYQIDSLIKKFNTSATQWNHDVTAEGVLWTKGADVASGAALPVLNDGARVDVTGTSTITSIDSVGVGTIKCLQFDDVLTLTHHATDIILPYARNIVTAAGDIAVMHEYAAGKWEMLSFSKSLIGWDLVQKQTASVSATIDFTAGLTAASDFYMVKFDNIVCSAESSTLFNMVLSTSSTWKTGASDYQKAYLFTTAEAAGGGPANGADGDNTTDNIQLNHSFFGVAAGESLSGKIFIYNLASATTRTRVEGITVIYNDTPSLSGTLLFGDRNAAEVNDGIRFKMSSGNIQSGSISLYKFLG